MKHQIFLAVALTTFICCGYTATTVTSTPDAEPTTIDRAALRDAVIAGNYTGKVSNLSRQRCPDSCSAVGLDSSAWFAYHSVERLTLCNSTMLLDFSIFNELEDPSTQTNIAACTADLASTSDTDITTGCQRDGMSQIKTTSQLQLASSGAFSSAPVADIISVLGQLRAYTSLAAANASCDGPDAINFASSGNAVVGMYVGSGLVGQGIMTTVLDQFSSQIASDGIIAENLFVQLCENQTARYSLGIFANTQGDLASAQLSVQSWKNSTCISTMDTSTPAWQDISYQVPVFLSNSSLLSNSSSNTSTYSNTSMSSTSIAGRSFLRSRSHSRPLDLHQKRANCATIQVVSGDSCGTLATACGITGAQFTTYNPSSTLCSTLSVGQHVCCTSGTLPDYTPKPDANGNCYSYLVVPGDYCAALAATYSITVAAITSFNTQTWGWNGCTNLLAGYKICLSSGYPPMPMPVTNAVCGPQVPNTAVAPPGTNLTQLNQCPLNACCDIWGQCGTTTEFCTISRSATGAPGTAAAGQNGCISNCGTSIVFSQPPAKQFNIAYFEGFDWQRPCLTMSVQNIDTSVYTHVHFAFATLNTDFSINIDTIANQLPFLQGLSGIKRIISIGGWSFSTDPSTYMIFRNAVSSAASRNTLVKNVIAFVQKYNLDGVDWDWEYPDEPDIPGIPAGSAMDSVGYFLMLDQLRNEMPVGKTISVAVPASFWYLQHFSVQAISLVVDYIVYMTYDLHGQWDYGNAFSDPGCSSGNCLRSHVNLTETVNALSMITKAGVPSNKVAVGVSSYGRSFQMTTAGCWTEQCTFTGPLSGALPGQCTQTAGYISDYEIGLIISSNPTAKVLWDDASYTNIVVYNGNQWVAYMNETTKATRKSLYGIYSFLGSSDWAVDLQSLDGVGSSSGSGSASGSIDTGTVYINPNIWNSVAPVKVTAMPGMTLIWPPMPLSSTTTITFPLWTTTVSYSSLTTATKISAGSTSTYLSYVYVSWLTIITIPSVTTTAIPVWAVTLGTGSTTGAIYLTSSVEPPPFAFTLTPIMGGTTSRIGATTTSTTLGGVIVWGSYSYFQPTQTETLGGSTTVIGGITFPPHTTTIIPGPWPTSVDSTTDGKVNSKSYSWSSGKPVQTSLPGCDGCGLPCLFFCDSWCPFCPPGIFGIQGSGENNNPSSTSTSTGSTASFTYTVGYDDAADDYDDSFGVAYNSPAEWSLYWAEYGTPYTRTSTAAATTTTPIIGSTGTTALLVCNYWDSGKGYFVFVISGTDTIPTWVSSRGKLLRESEAIMCGEPYDFIWGYSKATIYLQYFLQAKCIEKGIIEAGGPAISCIQLMNEKM